jgi:eukaryotic-like serine/threonine-protein kinase
MKGDRKPVPYLRHDFGEEQARFSPDGRWIAYVSDESARRQVQVRSFPSGDQKSTISPDEGTAPVWRRDGKELFYLAAGGKLMSVEVTPGVPFQAGAPRLLFEMPRGAPGSYDMSADGQRVLVATPVEDPGVESITLMLNWTTGLRK